MTNIWIDMTVSRDSDTRFYPDCFLSIYQDSVDIFAVKDHYFHSEVSLNHEPLHNNVSWGKMSLNIKKQAQNISLTFSLN